MKQRMMGERRNPEESPPTRGRELKLERQQELVNFDRSPPTRGRELKQPRRHLLPVRPSSPPTRGRELKLVVPGRLRAEAPVAPHAGA